MRLVADRGWADQKFDPPGRRYELGLDGGFGCKFGAGVVGKRSAVARDDLDGEVRAVVVDKREVEILIRRRVDNAPQLRLLRRQHVVSEFSIVCFALRHGSAIERQHAIERRWSAADLVFGVDALRPSG